MLEAMPLLWRLLELAILIVAGYALTGLVFTVLALLFVASVGSASWFLNLFRKKPTGKVDPETMTEIEDMAERMTNRRP